MKGVDVACDGNIGTVLPLTSVFRRLSCVVRYLMFAQGSEFF
jgi:hypothetical protein